MTDIRLGWDPIQVDGVIKQGSAASLTFTVTATKQDGSALDSYDGWTALLRLSRNPQSDPEIAITPTVAGDAPNKQFTVTAAFREEDTADKEVGDLKGDVCMISPTNDRYYPANIMLSIERSVAVP